MSRRFQRLVVEFQIQEIELSIDQNQNQDKKPTRNKRWNPNLKNNLNKWEKPMSIEKLHTMLRDHRRLRAKCRSLMASINDATQTNKIDMFLEMIGWMRYLRRLAIDFPPEPRGDARVPTLKLIQKASKSLPNLETLFLYCGEEEDQIISPSDVVKYVQFPALKWLELWCVRPKYYTLSLLRRVQSIRKMTADRPVLTSRLWAIPHHRYPEHMLVFSKWPKDLTNNSLKIG